MTIWGGVESPPGQLARWPLRVAGRD
jgi:hypothetical protein